jgi:5-methylcytosine-specific restriction enzyme subunit McrC
MATVTVREYARLTAAEFGRSSLDEAQVSPSAFEWLIEESARLSKSGAGLVHQNGRAWIKLANYVGVLRSPCGTTIEILPKLANADQGVAAARRVVRRMVLTCLNLRAKHSSIASIDAFQAPLNEWVSHQFLRELDQLVKRGVRLDYRSEENQERFLRGRLLVDRQIRESPSRQHRFHIRHDVFDADRPENRLLRSALELVRKNVADAANWRLAHELWGLLADIPPSRDIRSDFSRWGMDRLLSHYSPVRPWTWLILEGRSPLSLLGSWSGPSLLFPMEKLFERYVETCIRKSLPEETKLTPQVSYEHLCVHREKSWFNLRPDLLIARGPRQWVLDTKWKLLDEGKAGSNDKYGLEQADFYQMFAYGQKYLRGEGDLVLVYPRTPEFKSPQPVFQLTANLRLWVVPFEIETGTLLLHKHLASWTVD